MGLVRCSDVKPPHLCRGGAHCRKIPMASSTAHPPAANSLRNRCPCRCCRHRPPCCLSTLMSTSHPPTTTALRDGLRCRHPCLPPRRQLTLTLHPTAATASRDCLCPCLPPRRWSTSCIDINVASYRRHRHTRSLLLLLSPSLSLFLPPANVASSRCHRIEPDDARPPPPPPPPWLSSLSSSVALVVVIPASFTNVNVNVALVPLPWRRNASSNSRDIQAAIHGVGGHKSQLGDQRDLVLRIQLYVVVVVVLLR
jgi:hypothetical protein